jgi:hypothetical protein
MEERPPVWKVAANILKKQSRTDDEGLGEKLTATRRKNVSCYEMFTPKASDMGLVTHIEGRA